MPAAHSPTPELLTEMPPCLSQVCGPWKPFTLVYPETLRGTSPFSDHQPLHFLICLRDTHQHHSGCQQRHTPHLLLPIPATKTLTKFPPKPDAQLSFCPLRWGCLRPGHGSSVPDLCSFLFLSLSLFFFFVFVFFGHVCGMWKFLGQGSNPHHSSDPSDCRDNAGPISC